MGELRIVRCNGCAEWIKVVRVDVVLGGCRDDRAPRRRERWSGAPIEPLTSDECTFGA